tara:strand:- start:608 stop:826 length:219 start_codon:yes stop_codon:yes gene_type:complete
MRVDTASHHWQRGFRFRFRRTIINYDMPMCVVVLCQSGCDAPRAVAEPQLDKNSNVVLITLRVPGELKNQKF